MWIKIKTQAGREKIFWAETDRHEKENEPLISQKISPFAFLEVILYTVPLFVIDKVISVKIVCFISTASLDNKSLLYYLI